MAVAQARLLDEGAGHEIIGRGPTVREELRRFREAGNPIFYVQRIWSCPAAILEWCLLDGEYVGVYAREAAPDAWNTTVRRTARIGPRALVRGLEVARKAQEAFGLDYTTVDIVETVNGSHVLEVSAFGGFRGLYEGCGVNAAELAR